MNSENDKAPDGKVWEATRSHDGTVSTRLIDAPTARVVGVEDESPSKLAGGEGVAVRLFLDTPRVPFKLRDAVRASNRDGSGEVHQIRNGTGAQVIVNARDGFRPEVGDILSLT